MSHEGNNKSNESGVGDILQAVETQLQQLRTVQQNQEEDARALAERTKKLVEKEQAISERQRVVKAHVAKIEQERAAIESRRADLEQEVAAWNAAQQKRLDAERDRETQREMLEKELAERREGLDVAASSIDKLSARVSQLETDLNTAHERADEITTESLELLKTAEQERDQVRKELEELRSRGTSDGEEMQSLQAKLDEAIALVKAQEATIVEQAERLKNASQSGDEATEERLVELECELEAKQQEVADQRQKLEEQEQKLEALQAAVEHGESGSNDGQLEDLRRKAQRLATVAEHMKRRHARLKRARELVRRKRSGSRGQAAIESERRTALTKHLERQRRELLELKQNIALAERKMIRRWARPRSVIIVGWLLMLVLFSAAVGWFGADRYFPAVVSASVTMEIDESFDGEIDENLDAKWKAWHTAFVESREFIDTLSKRLNERQIIAYSSPEAVRDRLLRDLGIDEVEAGEMTFTLAGSDRKTMLVFMDLFAATLARRSGKAHRGTEMPWASVRDTREETGDAFTATIGSIPLEDERLRHAGPIAGIVFATLLMLIGVAYSKLVRAKREFDDSGDLFDALSEGKFSMPSA